MIHKKITSSLFAFTIAACSIQAAPATAIAKDATGGSHSFENDSGRENRTNDRTCH